MKTRDPQFTRRLGGGSTQSFVRLMADNTLGIRRQHSIVDGLTIEAKLNTGAHPNRAASRLDYLWRGLF